MPLHRNVYSFVYRGEDTPETRDVIWIHHQTKNDLQSPIVAEIWIKNKWEPLIWGSVTETDNVCCCCGSPFVREEGKASAAMREASNIAKGKFAFSAGHNASAFADNSMAIGEGVVATKPYQIVIGKYNNQDTNALFVVGAGESDINRKNAIEIDALGNVTIDSLNLPQTTRAWNIGSGDDSAELPGGSTASGNNAIAGGLDTTASGDFSITVGRDTTASGWASAAFGTGTLASADEAVAFGSNGTASGKASFVCGHRNTASGNYSFAGGWSSSAAGQSSFASGMYCEVTNGFGFSTGYGNQSNGKYSFTANHYTVATNESESAFGQFNKVNNNQIFSIGIGTAETDRRNALEVYSSGVVKIQNLEGYVKTELLQTNEDLKSVSLGYGASASGEESIAIGHQVNASGERAQAFGDETEATGYGSHAEGYYTTASGHESHSEGSRTIALGAGSHSEGYANDTYECVAFGNGSHAEGSSIANGSYSHSEGKNILNEITISYENGSTNVDHTEITADFGTLLHSLRLQNITDLVGRFFRDENHDFYQITEATQNSGSNYTIGFYPRKLAFRQSDELIFQFGGAYGHYSHTEGKNCEAYGNNAHAGGEDSIADGESSFASGHDCHTGYSGAVAMGIECGADGEASVALGNNAYTDGESAISIGYHTIATQSEVVGQFACGKYNDQSVGSQFSIGIGADDEHRKNAIEVLENGTILFYNVGDGNYYSLEQIINAINS